MPKKKQPFPLIPSLIMGGCLSLVVVFFTYFNLLADLERSAFDLRFSLRGIREPSPDILIVGITDECLKKLGRWPWQRHLHAELLDVLTEGDAAVIGMDIIFSEPAREVWTDEALAAATVRAGNVIYPSKAPPVKSQLPGFLSPYSLTLPLPSLLKAAPAGFINVTTDLDGIIRRGLLWMEHEGEPIPSFALLTWALAQGLEPSELQAHLENFFVPGVSRLPLGDFIFPLDPGGNTLINYRGPPGTFPVLPYHLVLAGEYAPTTFNDAIVLVGFFAPGLGDYFFAPFAKDTPMYGVEIHANIIQTLLESGPINNLPLFSNLGLVFILSLLPLLLYQVLKPIRGFIALVLLVIIFYLSTWKLFDAHALYIETVYPLLALGSSYLVSLVYNFTVEQREKQRITSIFGRYVAPQVVDEILQAGEGELKLGGIRRRITLLFIDIRGFTPLSEKLSPEKVVGVLNQYFEIVTRCVFENKGTIDKFMGDAAMALFNAPLLLDDHALWAVRAAQAITAEGAALQKRVRKISGATLTFGIGINTGEVVVGNIGSENRMDYTAIGDAVNLASRLESNAKPGQVLVSESVYREVAGRIPLESVGEISVKGKSQPIAVYQLTE